MLRFQSPGENHNQENQQELRELKVLSVILKKFQITGIKIFGCLN